MSSLVKSNTSPASPPAAPVIAGNRTFKTTSAAGGAGAAARPDQTPFRFTGKEPDSQSALANLLLISSRTRTAGTPEETGLYYYGARYLDPRTSRWLPADPAMGEYIPGAPVNDETRRRNGNLPGMGGVFNYVNLHVYHYAGNNPVKYTDPDGEWVAYNPETGLTSGWGHYGFPRIFGYFNIYDALSYGLGFSIHGTKLNLGDTTLRLWKGNYGLFGAGGEIGLYNSWGKSLNKNELAERGIESTSMELYHVKDGLIASRTEGGNGKKPSFWTTAFTLLRFSMKKNLYSINTITFSNEKAAHKFASGLDDAINEMRNGIDYFKNKNISIDYKVEGKSVIIYYGVKQNGIYDQ